MCVAAAGDSNNASMQRKKLLKAIKKYLNNGDYERAIKTCTKTLKINPLDDGAYFKWGFLFFLQNAI